MASFWSPSGRTKAVRKTGAFLGVIDAGSAFSLPPPPPQPAATRARTAPTSASRDTSRGRGRRGGDGKEAPSSRGTKRRSLRTRLPEEVGTGFRTRRMQLRAHPGGVQPRLRPPAARTPARPGGELPATTRFSARRGTPRKARGAKGERCVALWGRVGYLALHWTGVAGLLPLRHLGPHRFPPRQRDEQWPSAAP